MNFTYPKEKTKKVKSGGLYICGNLYLNIRYDSLSLWPSSDGPQPNIKILFLRGTLKSS
jgi:hypothetical protein